MLDDWEEDICSKTKVCLLSVCCCVKIIMIKTVLLVLFSLSQLHDNTNNTIIKQSWCNGCVTTDCWLHDGDALGGHEADNK